MSAKRWLALLLGAGPFAGAYAFGWTQTIQRGDLEASFFIGLPWSAFPTIIVASVVAVAAIVIFWIALVATLWKEGRR